MAGYFSVKNFGRFQHYKDRKPPWIKFYNETLDDYALGQLPDASKAHLFAIWLLASCYENQIPADAEWLARRINATEPVDLKLLSDAGFIELDQECSKLLAERYQDARPEREGETENIEPPLSPSGISPQPPPIPENLRRTKEANHASTRAKRAEGLAADWTPSVKHFELGSELGFDRERVEFEAGCFRDHAADKGRIGKDWEAAFRNWLRKAPEFSGRGNGVSGKYDASAGGPEPRGVVAALSHLQSRATRGGG